MKYGCSFAFLIFCTLIIMYGLFIKCIQLLWNWLMPLFWNNAPVLTYLETAGCIIFIMLIYNLLFNKNKNENY